MKLQSSSSSRATPRTLQTSKASLLAPLRHRNRIVRVRAVLEKDVRPLNATPDSSAPPHNEPAPSLDAIAPQQKLPLKRLTCEKDQAFLFSYGALMSIETIARRSARVQQRMPAVIVDPAVQLCFRHRGGYATLLAGGQPAHKPFLPQVHGVLYLVSRDDLKRLAKGEGGYELRDVEVSTYDGWSVTASAFLTSPLALLPGEVQPTEKYMHTLRGGAADNFLHPLWQAYLSSIPTVPSVGLGPEYFNTPSKYLAYGFLAIVAVIVAGFFAQQ